MFVDQRVVLNGFTGLVSIPSGTHTGEWVQVIPCILFLTIVIIDIVGNCLAAGDPQYRHYLVACYQVLVPLLHTALRVLGYFPWVLAQLLARQKNASDHEDREDG